MSIAISLNGLFLIVVNRITPSNGVVELKCQNHVTLPRLGFGSYGFISEDIRFAGVVCLEMEENQVEHAGG